MHRMDEVFLSIVECTVNFIGQLAGIGHSPLIPFHSLSRILSHHTQFVM